MAKTGLLGVTKDTPITPIIQEFTRILEALYQEDEIYISYYITISQGSSGKGR